MFGCVLRSGKRSCFSLPLYRILEMLHCFTSSFRQSSSYPRGNHTLTSQENSAGNTPRSNALSSPSVNLSIEFTKVNRNPSYIEVWNKIEVVQEWENVDVNQFLIAVLHPNREHVDEVLQHASSNPLTKTLSTYFEETEKICHQLLFWERGIRHTYSLYIQIKKLIDFLSGDSHSLDQAQCNFAYDIFLQFEKMEDTFPSLGSYEFDDTHGYFSDRNEQVDGCLCKLLRFTVTAASVAVHALAALATGSSFPPSPKLARKDLAHIAQQDPVALSNYVLRGHLQTTDRLAEQLQTAIEGDRSSIRVGIAQGRVCFAISLVVNRLAKSHPNVVLLLGELKVHICRCFDSMNGARSQLLHKIQIHQSL